MRRSPALSFLGNYRANRAAALAKWRGLFAARHGPWVPPLARRENDLPDFFLILLTLSMPDCGSGAVVSQWSSARSRQSCRRCAENPLISPVQICRTTSVQPASPMRRDDPLRTPRQTSRHPSSDADAQPNPEHHLTCRPHIRDVHSDVIMDVSKTRQLPA